MAQKKESFSASFAPWTGLREELEITMVGDKEEMEWTCPFAGS